MIERRFVDLSDENRDALHAGASFGFGDVFGATWDDLLKSRRILILAEAGAGKSHECREQQKRLWAEGKAAFYLDLNDIANRGATDCLDPDDLPRFEAWRSAEVANAFFFLDSIDELSLTHTSLVKALTRLRQDITTHLERATIVLTSRPVPFDEAAMRAK